MGFVQDFFANMHLAANEGKAILSRLYMRYDCSTQVVYVLVLVNTDDQDVSLLQYDDDNFVKIDYPDDDKGFKKVVDGAYPADVFQYIGTSGWEASFPLAPGSYGLHVHAEVELPEEEDAGNFINDNDDDGETSAVIDRNIPLTLDCLGSIGDYVWYDDNTPMVQDEDPSAFGLENITVRLFKETAPFTFEQVGEETTDGNGYYLFSGLPAGKYKVDVHNPDITAAFPSGWISTTNNDPYPQDADNVYDLAHGEDHEDADFGYDDLGDFVALGDWIGTMRMVWVIRMNPRTMASLV